MTAIRMEDGLPFITVVIHANGERLLLLRVLVDTGSAGVIMETEDLKVLGVAVPPTDPTSGDQNYVGVQIDGIQIDDKLFGGVIVQPGLVQRDVQIDAILGVDFLTRIRASLDFDAMELRLG